jgi:hypothetical protein
MNRDEIRKRTCIIIRKDGEYLVGTICFSTDLRWSWSAYDAWQTRRKEDAERVARATGGVMVLFNPIVGQKRVIGT